MTSLSYPQRRIWFAESLVGASSTYNIPMMFEIGGDIDRDALTGAVSDVLGRHEVLRTLIRDTAGVPEVGYARELEPTVSFVHTTVQDEQARVSSDIQAPFDLSVELPLRCTLYERSETGRGSLLVFVFHHIVADDHSLHIFMRDFGEFYTARAQGVRPVLPDLKASYADFADWQMRPDTPELDPEYWRAQLAGIPEEIFLPRDHARSATASHEGGWVDFDLTSAASDALRGLAKETRATNFMVWHAALAALMYRLGAGTDVVLGTVSSGRPTGDFRDVIGCFVNTLALRVDLSGNPTFRDVLARTRTADFEALLHQHVPFDRIVEVVNPIRVASRHPIVQVVLEYEKKQPTAFNLAGLEVDAVDATNYAPSSAKFDLAVVVREDTNGRMSGGFLYSKDLFVADTIQAMRDHLLNLVLGLLEQPDLPVRDIALNSERQVGDLLSLSKGPVAALEPHTVPDLILRRCAEAPSAIAVNDGREAATYGDLGERINRLTRALRQRGIGPGDTVAIEMPRSVGLVVSTVAVLNSGAAYLHLETDLPTERRAAMLDQAAPSAIMTREFVEAEWPPDEGVRRNPPLPPATAARSDDSHQPPRAAYVVFTSGSTGTPKGVVGTHLGLLNFLSAMGRVTGLTPRDRVLSISGLSFDAVAREMLLPLASGAALYFVSDYEPGNAEQVAQAVVELEINVVLAGTPSYLTQIGLELARRGSSLSLTVSAGESIRKISTQARRGLGRLINMYGPTECTMTTTVHDVSHDPDNVRDIVGRPLPNCAVYLLDESLDLVPRGAIGTVHISGHGITHGYLRDPGQTAQKYIPCPFGAPGSRMYATGDLARWRTDGALEFLGRRDSQLKVRGVRVEASEVEMRLTQIPGIDEAFVCMADNAQGEEVLVAYVGVRDGEFDARRTREKLMPFLPAGLAPAGFVSLHELPKLPNGKIDRSALPDPQLRTTSESRPPATDLERALCALLAESLGLSNIGADDNFFELGGHSLLVAGVLAKVRDTYDVRLSFHDFFSNPTAARLATSVEEQVTEKVLGLPESQLRALFGGGVIE